MQIVSSYGVEVKKQNIPIRHTLDIFRKAVSYLVEVYAESWEELSEMHRSALMKPNIWYMKRKRIVPDLRLTAIFPKCRPI